MKVLYFLALVVLCLAAPIDSPPKDVKVTVHQENDKICFTARWKKVKSSSEDPILGYKVLLSLGTLYFNFKEKEDGSNMTEVYAPSNPEKPIKEIAEFDVPASQNEYTYDGMQKGVVYQLAVLAYTAKGRGPWSENAMFACM